MEPTLLPRAFYLNETTAVARALLGMVVVRADTEGVVAGVITETEAYLPYDDPAAHGFIGRTQRNQSMFLDGGHAYIHTLRQYPLLDIVAEPAGVPGGVLIRSLMPIAGVPLIAKRRGITDGDIDPVLLTNGPGKLGLSLGLTRALDGVDMTTTTAGLFVVDIGIRLAAADILVSNRIGITKAADALLRFRVLPTLVREGEEEYFRRLGNYGAKGGMG